MSTFTDIYKQELKSKGILSSLSSAAGKRLREKTDVRNILFGGKGIFSATGQKIFGKGYSALGKDKSPLSTSAPSSPSENLTANIERVVKNTAPISGMRKDIGYMRKDISKLVKLLSDKSGGAAPGTDGSDSSFGLPGLDKLKGIGKNIFSGLSTAVKSPGMAIIGTILGASLAAKKGKELNDVELDKPQNYNVPSNRAEREGITKGQAGARNAAEARAKFARTRAQANDVVKTMAERKLSGPAAEQFLREVFPQDTPTLSQILEECDGSVKDFYTKKIAETQAKAITPAPSTAPSPATQDWRAAERESYGETAPTPAPSNTVTTESGIPVTTGTGGFVTSGKSTTPTASSSAPAPTATPSTTPEKTTKNNALLDEIAKGESASSGGYNAMNQGTIDPKTGKASSSGKVIGSGDSQKIINKKLTDMTVGEIMSLDATKEKDGEKRKEKGLIFAAGRYQIIPSTLSQLVKEGVVSANDKFNEETQDKLAMALVEKRLKGVDKNDYGAMQNALAKEWASIPLASNVGNRQAGESYYGGPGNKAHKGLNLKTALMQSVPSSGTALASSSGESSALRTQMATAPQQAPVVINSTNQSAPQRQSAPAQTASAFNESAADLFLNNVLIQGA
jgi:hypothetical protein